MTIGTRESRRQALVDFIAQQEGSCHVTAMLPSGRSKAFLEDRIREWVIRVNRHYMGRDWFTPRYQNARMTGFVCFEKGKGGWHAHMIIRPPSKAIPLHFLFHAPYFFKRQPNKLFEPFFGRAITVGGKMYAQKIGSKVNDLKKVASYDTKEMQFRDDRESLSWKFIDQLTACKGCR